MKTQLQAIRTIDPEAADYIENEVIPKYGIPYVERLVNDRGFLFWKKSTGMGLLDLFIWELTLQGRDYWLNIWRGINGK